jgi:hypothetical protein
MKTKRPIKMKLKLKVSPDKIDYSALTWYSDAKRLIKTLYGEHWKTFIGLLASTSPRVAVKKNWKLADSILSAYINRDKNPEKFADILGRLMPAHLVNVIRTLQGRPIKGQKVSRFAANLRGDLSVVTIDVWICRAYGIEHSRLTENIYNQLEQKIITEAKAANVKPANYQALIWYCIRRVSGRNPRSFVSVYNSILHETKLFDFMLDN